jgi:hypothetical protein
MDVRSCEALTVVSASVSGEIIWGWMRHPGWGTRVIDLGVPVSAGVEGRACR